MRILAACLITSALACARDLSVPAPSARPVITSFSPTAAFADAVLTIQGRNFSPAAADNVVQFGARSTRAFDFDAAGRLLVYVPEGTLVDLAGKISVTNKAGASDPSTDDFVYLGRGHPFLGTQVGITRFFHRPPGVAVLGSEAVLASTSAWAVMGASGFFAALSAEPTAFAGLPDQSAVFAAAGGRISGLPGRPLLDLGAVAVRFLSASPGSAHLIAAGVDPLGVAHVVGIAPAGNSKVFDRTLAGGVLGVAALDDGRAAVVQASAVVLVDAAAAPQSFAAPAALSGAIAAVPGGLAAAFADGSVRVLNAGVWGAPLATGSAEPFAAMVGSGNKVAGAKPAEGVVRILDLGGGALQEHFFTGRPRALFWTPANQVLVGNDASNVVETFDAANAGAGSRAAFPLGVGSSLGCGQGSAVEQDGRPEHYRYRFLATATRTNQLMAIDYNSLVRQAPVPLAAGSTPVRGIAMPGPQGVWIVHQTEIGRLQDDDTEKILTSALPGAQCLLFPDTAGAVVVVLSAGSASVLRGSTVTGAAALPGTVVAGGVRPDGKIVVFYGDPAQPGASPQARLYTVDALEHGGAPAAQFAGVARYQGFIGAFQTAWGPMLFFTWDAQAQAAGSYAVLLDDALQPRPAVAAGVPDRGPVRFTPDGYFALWLRADSRDNLLRVNSMLDLNVVYPYASYRLDGQPAAPAFDSTGEYMYVPVPEQDVIATFQ